MYDPEQKTIHEIIQVPAETGVRFFTSCDPGSYVPQHWHRAIEIIYLLEGQVTVTVETSSRLLHPGECVLINAQAVHATKCVSYTRGIVLQIPLEFMELYIPQAEQLFFSLDTPDSDAHSKVFRETLLQMQLVDQERPEGYLLRFNSLLFDLLFQLYTHFCTKVFQGSCTQRSKALSRLSPVLKYTAQNYNRPISIEEAAGQVFLQPGYFCRFFKKYMGITFLEYQNELRLSYIYRDLLTTEDTLSQILERHGFTNYKLFRRMFQEHFKATPMQIRKEYLSRRNS